MSSQPESYVKALYDFEYEKEDGKKIRIDKGELYILLKKTNDDWWQVIRPNVVDRITFYAPASYLEETDEVDLDLEMDRKCRLLNDEKVLKRKVNGKLIRKEPVKKGELKQRDGLKKEKGHSSSVTVEKPEKSDDEVRPPVRMLIVNNPLRAIEHDRLLGRCEDLSGTAVTKPAARVPAVKKEEDETVSCGVGVNVEEKKNKKNKEISNNSRMKGRAKPLPPRPESPIYANLPKNLPLTPPVPTKGETPLRVLADGWAEFADTLGRRFYYDEVRGKSSWKPPRRRSELGRDSTSSQGTCSLSGHLSDTELNSSRCDSSLESDSKVPHRARSVTTAEDTLYRPTPDTDVLPQGWRRSCDKASGEICYVNDATEERWFTSSDECGRIYYYPEHSKESYWQLPTPAAVTDDVFEPEEANRRLPAKLLSTSSPRTDDRVVSMPSPASSRSSFKHSPKGRTMSDRRQKTKSLHVSDPRGGVADNSGYKSSTLPPNFQGQRVPAHDDEYRLKGPIFRTKLTESGKRVRKNWIASFGILTDTQLALYKDGRQQIPNAKSELIIDLCLSQVKKVDNKSSRKNVFEITTCGGQQSFLLQSDDIDKANEWFAEIEAVINKLAGRVGLETRLPEEPPPSHPRLQHSKSIKRNGRSTESSTEDLDAAAGSTEKKVKIRVKLRNFFQRRPTMESLQLRGIIKDEPVFGCHLGVLCGREKRNVPDFVTLCIETIEKKDMKADGLYRASGNLSQVQRMRFRINQESSNTATILQEEEDVHVLTGALKLFFRELKEPLFPFQSFEKFLLAISLGNKLAKLAAFKELVSALPKPNHATLRYLLEHLNKVTKFHEHNRMHVQNLSIVFGPTLMWPAIESTNIAFDMMQQNQIVEFLLLELDNIFR